MAQDFRDAKSYKEKPEKRGKSGVVETRWWEESDDAELARAVVDTGSGLLDRAADRHQAFVRFARLYENCEFDDLFGRDYAATVVRQVLTGAGIS